MNTMNSKKVKRFFSVLLAVILLLGITACGKTVGTGNPAQEANVTRESESAEAPTEKQTKQESVTPETTTAADHSASGQNSDEHIVSGGAASDGTSSGGSSTGSNVPQPTEAPTQPPTEAPTEPPTEPPTWTISVTVDAGAYGGIFAGGTYTYYYQPTAYDALVSTGLGFTGSSYYVSGINGLSEFDHGRMSGWLYAVNGVEPGVGCGSYYLNDGDYVYWHYQGDE